MIDWSINKNRYNCAPNPSGGIWEKVMKSSGSLLLFFIFVFGALTFSFGQATRPQRIPVPPADFARFQSAEAFTDGQGAFVRWKMDNETGNLGFLVYKVTDSGLEQVSPNYILGSVTQSQTSTIYGGSYDYFDPQGTAATVYFVVSRALDGRRIESARFTPTFTRDLEGSTGYTRDFLIEHSQWQGGRVDAVYPFLTRDLTAVVNASRPAPDPVGQRRTVSLPSVKIAVKQDGMYHVSRTELQAAGFPVDSDPSTWRLFMNGNEQAINVDDGGQGIVFYGRGLDTFETDTRTYYLIQDTVAGRRMTSKIINSIGGNVVTNNYKYTTVTKERLTYIQKVHNVDEDNYFGQAIVDSPATIENFTLKGVDPNGPDALMQINALGVTGIQHHVNVVINGVDAGVFNGSGAYAPFGGTFVVPAAVLREGMNTLTLNTTLSNDSCVFNSVKVTYSRKYAADTNRVQFVTPGYRRAAVSGFTTPNIKVFDITLDGDPQQILDLPIVQDGSTFSVKMPSNRAAIFYAVGDSGYLQSPSVTADSPSSLASTDNGADMIIISYSSPQFIAAAETWAEYRRTRNGGQFNVRVVNIDDVFDEFSYGAHSGQGVKDFLSFAISNWHNPKPFAVLLIGDASHDRRNYEGFGNWDMVPTKNVDLIYEETGSDEALADINNPPDGLADLSIGRIPVRTAQAVQSMLNKTMLFETPSNQSLDRGAIFAFDTPQGYDFDAMSHILANQLPSPMPKTFINRGLPDPNPNMIQDPLAHQHLMDGVNAGPYIVNYSGHGTSGVWNNSSFFSVADAQQLTNQARPSLFTMLTCFNGYFLRPRPTDDSLGEALVKAPNGGAAATWASTTETTPDYQLTMGAEFYRQIASAQHPRLGDMIRYAKLTIAGSDVGYSWVLLGDPMLKIRSTPMN